MVNCIRATDRKLLYDENILPNLYTEKKRVIKYDNDSCILVTGAEGVGKTTGAAAIAYYMGYSKKTNTSNFNLDYIVFNMEQLREAVNKAKKGQVIMIDEFVLMALSTDALSSMQKDLIKLFVTHRFKNLIYIMIIPSIFMLGSYFATHRTSCLIHFYSPDRIQRGFYRFYNMPEKSNMYNYGKQNKTYKNAKYSFDGRFFIKSISEVGINKEEYEKKKNEAVSAIGNDEDKGSTKAKVAVARLFSYIKTLQPNISIENLVRETNCGMSYNYVRNVIKSVNDQDKHETASKTLKLLMPHQLKEKTEVI
jgi:hypothetical protein